MKEYLENRIKSLSARLEELYKEYDSATGAAKTAIAYRNCNLVEERLAELNDALKYYTEQFNKHGVMQAEGLDGVQEATVGKEREQGNKSDGFCYNWIG